MFYTLLVQQYNAVSIIIILAIVSKRYLSEEMVTTNQF